LEIRSSELYRTLGYGLYQFEVHEPFLEDTEYLSVLRDDRYRPSDSLYNFDSHYSSDGVVLKEKLIKGTVAFTQDEKNRFHMDPEKVLEHYSQGATIPKSWCKNRTAELAAACQWALNEIKRLRGG
jgi:hypothetical protein